MTPFSPTPEWLAERLERLATFSAPGPGVTRLVYDDAWCDAHAWLRTEAAALGLESSCDALGNLLLHPPGFAPGGRAILVGSHLDSVVHGGRLDGAYGVIAALALAAALRGSRVPVAAFVTCEEEGSRFPAALTGVRAMLGGLAPAELAELRDREGVRWADALQHARARGAVGPGAASERVVPLARAVAQLELHIEQGPVLERAAEKLGVVDRIAGYRRLHVTLTGEARHAGTTPMEARRDALAAAAEIALAAESLAREAGPPAVATAGFLRAEPGLFNVVPGHVEMGLESRHVRLDALAELAAAVEGAARVIAGRRGVGFASETRAAEPPAELDDTLAAEAAALAQSLGIPHRRMASGAGHDTMAFAAAGVPALMLFVPSRGGVSHSPEEHTSPRDLWTGLAFAQDLLPRWGGALRMTIEALDAAAAEDALPALERCCGARAWIAAMLAARPFRTREALHAAADRAFAPLTRADWLEAFSHHPRIGDVEGLRRKFASTAAWAGGEQSGAAAADEATLAALAEGNRAYEARFGHLFIVCATGLGAAEMLARLRARLPNEAADELRRAAEEQAKITHLRLDKLLEEA